MITPKAKTLALIDTHAATLQQPLSTILKKLGVQILELLHRKHIKDAQRTRIESDANLVPRSAKLNFELSVPREVEELHDFITLRASTAEDVSSMKARLKQRIIECIHIESKALSLKVREQLAHALHLATHAILISHEAEAEDEAEAHYIGN